MDRLLELDASSATDPRLVGGKAAGLSLALRAGLPVLPGWVIPLAGSRDAIRLAQQAGRRSGRPAAVRTASQVALDPVLLRDLTSLSAVPWIVRSSTKVDGDGRWAGAFATYHDLPRDLLPTGVRGCWASVFSADAVARSEAQGVASPVEVAVVIQPWLSLVARGTARIDGEGAIVAIADRTEPDASVTIAAAQLASRVHAETGDTAIEWGWARGRIHLLQVGTASVAAPILDRAAAPTSCRSPRIALIARIASRFPGPLGDEIVMPWALAAEDVPVAAPVEPLDPVVALAEARAIARELTASAWGCPADEAFSVAASVSRALLGPDPSEALVRLPAGRSFDPRLPGRLLGLVDRIGRGIDLLATPEDVWRLSMAQLEALFRRGVVPSLRFGPDRWESLVFEATRGAGETRSGRSAGAGIGAGPVCVVDGRGPGSSPRTRAVVAAGFPDPHLAPLLWRASAIVTASDVTGAHLFEVARSLGIPAVAGVDLLGEQGTLAAVDGDRGCVSILRDDERSHVALDAGVAARV